MPVNHQHAGHAVKYWRKLQAGPEARWRSFPKFPLVLNGAGRPWEAACLYLLDRVLARPRQLASLSSVAQGLKDYNTFLNELALDWDDFNSVDKYCRPTYLYKVHLQGLVSAGQIKSTTAARRMSTVIGFYRFAQTDSRLRFEPANAPWVEKTLGIAYKDGKGFSRRAEVLATDVAIRPARRDYAWDETLSDGGKLRPLTVEEQTHLIAGIKALDNVEYELMHYVALLTGAREQTVLTLRVRNFVAPPSEVTQWSFKLRCGPGTGIDTKRDVTDVYLSVPRVLYEKLHVYIHSDRAKRRRGRSRLGNDDGNYLFLTQHGKPFYESKDDRNADRGGNELLRSSKVGQGLRDFIQHRVIPEVRKTLPKFSYRFHDLRATFGMNWVDHNDQVDGTKRSHLWARDQLRKLMWHKNAETTDQYLEYREHLHHLEAAQQGWSRHLVDLINT